MTNQGATAQHRPEDGWWDAVYEGPAGTLPDTPGAVAGEGSVDDWFATAAGMIGARRGAAVTERVPPAEPAVEATVEAASEPAAPVAAGAERLRATEPPKVPEARKGTGSADVPGPPELPGSADVPGSADAPATATGPAKPRRPEWATRPAVAGESEDPSGGAGGPAPEAARASAGPSSGGEGEPSLDDWFDTAVGVIGVQRASDGPVVPAPVPAARPVQGPVPAVVPAEGPVPSPVPAAAVSGPGRAASAAPSAEPAPPALRRSVPAEPTGPAAQADPGSAEGDATHRFPTPSWAADAAPARPAETAVEPEPDAGAPGRVGPDRPGESASARSDLLPAASGAAAPDPTDPPAGRSPAAASAPAPVAEPASAPAAAGRPAGRSALTEPGPPVPHVGERPPTYGPEPTAVPAADPQDLGVIVPDTALEGAQYGVSTLRAVSVRGDSARYRGEPRRDSLLVTRFGDGPGGLVLAALAGFGRADGQSAPPAHEVTAATAEACRQLAAAIGRSRAELAADLRDGARDRLRYGLQRLATSASAPLRAVEGGARPADGPPPVQDGEGSDPAHPGSLHCLLLSLDPGASYRAAFGVGPGGLYLLRSGHWIDAYAARLLHHPDGRPVPDPSGPDPRPFRFRLVPATPGDILLLCTPGLAGPIAEESAVAHFLASHWAHPHPPGTVDFLRQVQVRAKGYADDRTAAAVWTD